MESTETRRGFVNSLTGVSANKEADMTILTAPHPTTNHSRQKAVKIILLSVLGLLMVLKTDMFLGGLLNFPLVWIPRILTGFAVLGAIVWFGYAVYTHRGRVLSLLVLIWLQPLFLQPGYAYAWGVYFRIRCVGGIPAVIAWGKDYANNNPITDSSPSTSMDPTTSSADEADTERVIFPSPRACPELDRITSSGLVTIDPKTRDVSVSGGGHFMGLWGLVIGQGTSSREMTGGSGYYYIRVSDDAFLWATLED